MYRWTGLACSLGGALGCWYFGVAGTSSWFGTIRGSALQLNLLRSTCSVFECDDMLFGGCESWKGVAGHNTKKVRAIRRRIYRLRFTKEWRISHMPWGRVTPVIYCELPRKFTLPTFITFEIFYILEKSFSVAFQGRYCVIYLGKQNRKVSPSVA